ncbi:thioesterase family protein [Microlunatus panaciterrae]|uniref:Thioesterase-like superfamily protein n=1 Tax=Microlunatus panaciterrae TaxID=400768 RepID=A0ABS2RPQ0_9ACTN|nr:thioesterase family protein [Microlunatus panaciterrae]MBM7800643.1 hypothetical protein [Microlunatus panaciterrae]
MPLPGTPEADVTLDPDSDSFYRPLGGMRFQPTLHSQGAWQPNEQHMGPVSGLIVHAVEEHVRQLHVDGDDLQLCRLSYDILGLIPAGPSEITVEVIRPGRTIELLNATMIAGGRPVVLARAWRLSRQDTTEVTGGLPEPMPAPDTWPLWRGSDVWRGGYIAAIEIRIEPGGAPGRVRAWLRTDKTLVEQVTSSDLARFVGLVDTANGIATRVPPAEWMFPNTDLSVHLYRTPVGGWVGLDTTVTFGRTGLGLTSSTLYDESGPVGRAEQVLTVRRLH